MTHPPPPLAGHFTGLDWLVLLGYFALTTLLGGWLAGRPASVRDFFLGGRRLPWYAVAGSIVATEISAVTFVGVPGYVYAGGDFRYLLLGVFGALLARIAVAWVLVPAYYAREIYSPYDYMGDRLGRGMRGMTTALFSVGGLMAQAARVYLTAVILELVLSPQLAWLAGRTGIGAGAWAILLIGAVAVGWTLMGGIATVIWTDLLLFGVFAVGAGVALYVVAGDLPGGFHQLLEVGRAAKKFRFWDFSPDPTKAFTVWTAVVAATVFSTGLYGTDQLMAQRIFCCRGVAAARLAVMASYVGIAVAAAMLLVGVGLVAFYQVHPPTGAAAARIAAGPDANVFPVFILTQLPAGVKGLLIAGIFAAAVSSLDSILAALSQTTLSAVYLPLRRRFVWRGLQAAAYRGREFDAGADPAEARHAVRASRVLVVIWGVLLCGVAGLVGRYKEASGVDVLNLALALATYTAGPLLAGFLLAFWPLRVNARGFLFAAPLAVFTVLATAWHTAWAGWACVGAGVVLLGLWGAGCRDARRFFWKWAGLLGGVCLMLAVWRWGYFVRDGGVKSVAWPWYAVVGALVAFAWGWGLADRTR